jgi:predicted AAA+ superfamily ATPase
MLDELFELSRHLVRQAHRPYRRYLMKASTFGGRCTLVLGQRGVGKTTCLVQHLAETFPDYAVSRKCLYLPADHFLVARTPLYEIARDFANQGGRLLCLDEAHKYLPWSRDMKSLLDTFPDLRVVASGSSMLHLHRGSHDLSRRAVVHQLHGMSFREYLELRLDLTLPALGLADVLKQHEILAPDLVAKVTGKKESLLGLFREYLECGFYPYFREYPNRDLFWSVLEQSMHTAIESDLVAIHPSLTGNSVARIKRLLAAIAGSVPFTPDLVKLRRLLDITDDRTLKTYLQYLVDAGLIMALHREGGGLKAMEKPDRLYLGDPNQAFAVGGAQRTDMGAVRETFFCRLVSSCHRVQAANSADFLVDGRWHVGVGGRAKTARQIAAVPQGYLAVAETPVGVARRIPLWLFGFLY